MGLLISIIKTFLEKIFPAKKAKGSKYEVDDGITVFHTGMSPPSRRVRITLLEKKIPFKLVDIKLLYGEQFNVEYTFVNPNRKVPAVAFKNVEGIPDGFYYESNVITELIDTVFPGLKLYSTDKRERAQIRIWQDYELGLVDDFVPLIYPNLIGFVLRTIFSDADELLESIDQNAPKAYKDRMKSHYNGVSKSKEELSAHCIGCYQNLLTLEQGLQGKKYLVGNRYTAADLSVFPRVAMFVLAGMPITGQHFPNVDRWMKLLCSREAVSKSEDFSVKFQRVFITYFPSIFVLAGNMKSGQRHHKRLDGSTLVEKAVNDIASNEHEDVQKLDNLDDIVVFNYPGSPDCLQTKLVLNILGIKYTENNCHVLNLIGRASGSQGVYKIYHNQQLIVGMRAILEYVCSLSPELELIPKDPATKAKIQSWQAWEQTMYFMELAPLVERDFLSKVLTYRYEKHLDDLLKLRSDIKYQHKFREILQCFMAGLSESSECWSVLREEYKEYIPDEENLTKQRNGLYELLHIRLQHLDDTLIHQEYLVGNSLTLADVCVFCRIEFFQIVGMKISTQKYPYLTSWILKLQAHKSFAEMRDSFNT